MGFFDKLFDFNRDGEVSTSEKVFGFSMAAAILTAAEEEERQKQEEQEREEQDSAEEDQLYAMFGDIDDLDDEDFEEYSGAELREKLEELQVRMMELDNEEPEDILGDAYDVWDEKRTILEEKIEEIESLLDD